MSGRSWIARTLHKFLGSRRRQVKKENGVKLQLEVLEVRVVPSGNTLYVGSLSGSGVGGVAWTPGINYRGWTPVSGLTAGTNAFTSIQAALNQSSTDYQNSGNADTIEVAPGVYTNDYTVSAPVALLGSVNSSPTFTNGQFVPDVRTTVVDAPSSTFPAGAAYNDVFRVLASGVAINGFFIDGQNVADDGISNLGTDVNGTTVQVNNITLQNNVIQNAVAGIYLDDASAANQGAPAPGAASTGNAILGNFFADDGRQEFGAVNLTDNFFATVSGNTINVPANLSVGIEAFNFNTSAVSPTPTLAITSNTVTVGQSSDGIFINNFYQSPIAVTLSTNMIDAAAGVTDTANGTTYGVAIKSILNNATVTETNDSIGTSGGQFAHGIDVWNTVAGAVSLNSTNVGTTSGSPAPVIGVDVHDVDSLNPPYTSVAPVALSITLGTINGTAYGLDVTSVNTGVSVSLLGVQINGLGSVGIALSGSGATVSNSTLATTVTGHIAALQAVSGASTSQAGLTKTFLITGSTITVPGGVVTASTQVGASGSFTLTTPGLPTATPGLLSSSPSLPLGVAYSPSSGAFTWPALGASGIGNYTLTFQATAGGVSVTQIVIFSVSGTAPQLASTGSATLVVGTFGSDQIMAGGNPTPAFTYANVSGPNGATALPSGVTLSSSGLLSGTAVAGTSGIYTFTITASNGVSPSATENFTLTVDQAPQITSANVADFTSGSPGSFQVTVAPGAYPAAVTFTASNISGPGGATSFPGSVTFSSSGLLSGTFPAGTVGSYTFTITASNGVAPNATQQFTAAVAFYSLPVTVTSDLMLQGSNPPPLTGTVNGAKFTGSTTFTTTHGDLITVTLSTAANSSSPVGSYPITAVVTGNNAANYFPPAPGTLDVVTAGGETSGVSASLFYYRGGSASNALTWLSDQTTNMKDNLNAGYVNTTDVVYASSLLAYAGTSFGVAGLDGGGFITVGNLQSLAAQAIAQYANPINRTTAFLTYMDAIANALQLANDDTTFVQQIVPPGF